MDVETVGDFADADGASQSAPGPRNARVKLRLPDFIGVGPPRTGTSWLHDVLLGHVALPRGIKETQFFRRRYSFGIEWYAKHFEGYPPALPAGEFGAAYFAWDETRDRIKLHLPRCRIICTLREPAERLYSHYKLLNRMAMIKGNFAELAFRHPDLLEFSRYAHHVREWQRQFGREQVLVLIHEDSYQNRQGYIDQVCNFIGIPSIDVSRIPWAEKNTRPNITAPRVRKIARRAWRLQERLSDGRYYRTVRLIRPMLRFWWRGGAAYPPLDPFLKQKIRNHLRPETDALEELIGRDLSHWK